MNTKDILAVVVIPVTLAVLALLWPAIQAGARRRAFRSLILRELEEIAPYPAEPNRAGWWEHQNKEFVHQKILADTSLNRDFILSLPRELVYLVSQLWARRTPETTASGSITFKNFRILNTIRVEGLLKLKKNGFVCAKYTKPKLAMPPNQSLQPTASRRTI